MATPMTARIAPETRPAIVRFRKVPLEGAAALSKVANTMMPAKIEAQTEMSMNTAPTIAAMPSFAANTISRFGRARKVATAVP